jgi:hypothetical protein
MKLLRCINLNITNLNFIVFDRGYSTFLGMWSNKIIKK